VAPWPVTRRARTHAILHQMLNGFFLRDLDEKRNPFCILISVETDHGWMATRRRLGQPSTAVRVAPGGESTREIAPTAVVWVGYHAPGGESMRGASARRIDGGGLLGGGGSVGAKSAWGMALFIGETHLLVEDAETNSILSLI
jgi:uncharacterized membrane protein YgcG